MKKIKLGVSGKYAIVDDEWHERLSKFKWRYLQGYAIRSEYTPERGRERKQFTVSMHREILGAKKGELCDHVNRDRLDNRTANLRIATKSLNQVNKAYSNKTGYRGVYWKKGYYQARIMGKYVKSSKDPKVAAAAYDQAAKELYGEFAVLNFP